MTRLVAIHHQKYFQTGNPSWLLGKSGAFWDAPLNFKTMRLKDILQDEFVLIILLLLIFIVMFIKGG